MGYWSTCGSELVFTREGRKALTRAMLAVAMLGGDDAEPPIDDLGDEDAQQSRRQFHAALRYYMPCFGRGAAGEDEGGGAGEEGEGGEEARRLRAIELYLWAEEGAEHEEHEAGAEELNLRMLEREGKNYSAGQFLGGCFERGWLDLERTEETIRFVGEDDETWGYRLGETPVGGGEAHTALLYVDFEKCLPREPGESSDDEYDPESEAHNAEGRGVCPNCDWRVARAPQWSDAGLCQACEWQESSDLDDVTEGESHVEWQWAAPVAAAEPVAVPAAEAPLLAAGGGDDSGGGGGGGGGIGGAAPPAAPAAAPSAPPLGAAAATAGGGGGSTFSSSSSSSSSSSDDDDGNRPES
jgi:hypothetical protein